MSFENYNYYVYKDPYEWCLGHSKRLKAIDPPMNIHMRNHILLTQIPGELERAVKVRFNQNCTQDDIENTLQDVRRRTNIGKYTPYKSSGFKEKQPFRVELRNKPRERVAEVAKKKKFILFILICSQQVPEEESPTEDSDSDSMGYAIREQSDDNQDPREELLVEYQEETQIEIQGIQLEAGMPQDTANKNLCKHIQDAQKFLVKSAK
ncbi:hypothetical protein O181_037035 [Austropuccinia psidii MF-1]|uniref:Uncharacterized protein n=1 Tax=Austropuccinia psidii MF-1 TaxID=1389203 RepID=A0A9Q3HCQ9_9BASI|nr:hypothetical protein [Austropuccinia psidii MF-1]